MLARGELSTVPVPALVIGPKSLYDTWPISHFWLAAPVQAATLALAPRPGPVTSRHRLSTRSVPSLLPVQSWEPAPGLHFRATTVVPSAARVMHIPLKGPETVPVPAGKGPAGAARSGQAAMSPPRTGQIGQIACR